MRILAIISCICLAILPLLAQQDNEKTEKSFAVYDVIIEVEEPMASWQLEVFYKKENLNFVGIEGGEGVFGEPADYDEAGWNGGHIILACYSLEEDLPKGKVQVSRVHVLENSGEMLKSNTNLMVVADKNGKILEGKVSLKKVEQR